MNDDSPPTSSSQESTSRLHNGSDTPSPGITFYDGDRVTGSRDVGNGNTFEKTDSGVRTIKTMGKLPDFKLRGKTDDLPQYVPLQQTWFSARGL